MLRICFDKFMNTHEVSKGSGAKGQIRIGASTCFGKTIEYKSEFGRNYLLNSGSVIDFLKSKNSGNIGKHLKKGFLGIGRSKNNEVQKTFDKYIMSLHQGRRTLEDKGIPPSPSPTLPKAKIYMSLTGNPTHLGHMMVIATTIDALAKKNIHVDEVKVSLSHDSYLQSKVKKDQAQGTKKVALSQEAREHLLLGAIQEAKIRDLFKGVEVNYWNDQKEGYSDHPESYARLAKKFEKTHQIYLAAGSDLCLGMRNWPTVEHAVIIERDASDSEPIVYPHSNKDRIYVKPLHSEFADLSSTKIQNGTKSLSPPELQEYFQNACNAPTTI